MARARIAALQGSLAIRRGVLAVGTQAKTASVRFFDLVGRELAAGFSFRDARVGRSAVGGLALDDDHRVWVADTPSSRVRAFTLFGREVGDAASPAELAGLDRPGNLEAPQDVELLEDGQLAIACGGERRHAVQLTVSSVSWPAVSWPNLSCVRSLAACGDARRPFHGVRRIAARGRFLYVVEAARRCIQVFRDGEFLFLFHVPTRTGERCLLSAIAPLPDGRMVVACGGADSALLLLDGAGRVASVLARSGSEDGSVLEPSDLSFDAGPDEARSSLFVLDRDGTRVQVFTLAGRCLGVLSIASGEERGRQRREKKGGR